MNLLITLNKMAISKFWLDVFGEMVGVVGGLVAFQTLSTIKKGTSLFNSQSNELFSKFLRKHMAISEFLSDAFQGSVRCVCVQACVGEGIYPPITLNLKKGIRTYDHQSNDPLRILHDHPFYLYLVCPQA